jgi:hypothetical protein
MKTSEINETQAVAIVQELVASGRVTSDEVTGALAAVVGRIEARLETLRGEFSGVGVSPTIVPKKSTVASKSGKSSKHGDAHVKKEVEVSPERTASRQLQGRYIAAIRQVPKSRRKEFQTIVEKRGRESAIRAINRYLKGKAKPKAKTPKVAFVTRKVRRARKPRAAATPNNVTAINSETPAAA